MLFATAACNFSTSELQQVVRDRQFSNILTSKFVFRHSGVQFFDIRTSKSTPRPSFFLNILTSKGVFRHSGVQFLISLLSTYLCTRRFDRPTFRLSRHTNHGKNAAFRDFSNIWCGCIFFLLNFALLHLLSADLTTLLCFSTVRIELSEVRLLNFFRSFPYIAIDGMPSLLGWSHLIRPVKRWVENERERVVESNGLSLPRPSSNGLTKMAVAKSRLKN